MKNFRGMFFGEAITTRAEVLALVKRQRGSEITDPRLHTVVVLGRIDASSLRGWIRAGVSRLFLEAGVQAIHAMPSNALSSGRNADLFKKDLKMGFLPRDAKEAKDHVMYSMFGDLDHPGNLGVSHVFFYPNGTGGKLKQFNKIFGETIGSGRTEVGRNSPGPTHNTAMRYLTTEYLVFSGIEAPITIFLREPDEDHAALLVMGLDYINKKSLEWDFDFLLGGKRNHGCGRACVWLGENFRFNHNSVGLPKDEFNEHERRLKAILEVHKENFALE